MRKYFAASFVMLFFSLLLSSCSSIGVQRTPASTTSSCYESYEQLFGAALDHTDLTELRHLFIVEIRQIQKSDQLLDLVATDGLLENQRKNQIILGMLKRTYPKASDDELTEHFWKQFKRCD